MLQELKVRVLRVYDHPRGVDPGRSVTRLALTVVFPGGVSDVRCGVLPQDEPCHVETGQTRIRGRLFARLDRIYPTILHIALVAIPPLFVVAVQLPPLCVHPAFFSFPLSSLFLSILFSPLAIRHRGNSSRAAPRRERGSFRTTRPFRRVIERERERVRGGGKRDKKEKEIGTHTTVVQSAATVCDRRGWKCNRTMELKRRDRPSWEFLLVETVEQSANDFSLIPAALREGE